MPLNNYYPLTTVTVPACGIYYIDVDMRTVTSMQVDTIVSYEQTSSTTGILLNLRYSSGIAASGDPAEWIVMDAQEVPGTEPGTRAYAQFSTSYTPVALEPIEASSTDEEEITVFNIDVNSVPRWLRFELTNSDPNYDASVQLKFDL